MKNREPPRKKLPTIESFHQLKIEARRNSGLLQNKFSRGKEIDEHKIAMKIAIEKFAVNTMNCRERYRGNGYQSFRGKTIDFGGKI